MIIRFVNGGEVDMMASILSRILISRLVLEAIFSVLKAGSCILLGESNNLLR